jgi:TetR/AcrR family transcriptional regulator, transcriptional repressor of aconitase
VTESAGTPDSIGRPGAYAKGLARREEILDHAIEVFRARGTSGTSLRKIAEAIGVSHAALLHYFTSREELLLAVYDRAERQRPPATFDNPVDVAAAWARSNADVPGLVELYTTLVAAALETPTAAGRPYFTRRFENARTNLTEKLREQQERGTVRADVDPEHIAALLIAASDGLQIQSLLDPGVEMEATLRTFAALLRL